MLLKLYMCQKIRKGFSVALLQYKACDERINQNTEYAQPTLWGSWRRRDGP